MHCTYLTDESEIFFENVLGKIQTFTIDKTYFYITKIKLISIIRATMDSIYEVPEGSIAQVFLRCDK